MIRVDTLLLAKYGIFQPTRRNGPLVMTILHPLESLTADDRADLTEFAQMCVAEHGLGDFSDRRVVYFSETADRQSTAGDERHDERNEGVLHEDDGA